MKALPSEVFAVLIPSSHSSAARPSGGDSPVAADPARRLRELEAALLANGLGSFRLDLRDGGGDCSARAREILGLECDADGPWDLPALLRQVQPGERDAALAGFALARSARRPWQARCRLLARADGLAPVIELRGGWLLDADGEPEAFAGTVAECDEADAVGDARQLHLQTLTDAVEHLLWSSRADGHTDYFNERWYEFTGIAPGATDGAAWSSVLHPDDAERAALRWQHSVDTGLPYLIEYRLRHAAGGHRWVLARALAARDGRGEIVRWYGSCTDIQETVEAREALSRSAQAMQRLVAERTAETDRLWRNSPDLLLVLGVDRALRNVNPAWRAVLGYEAAQLIGRPIDDFIHPDDRGAAVAGFGQAAREPVPVLENRFRHADGGWRWLQWTVAPDTDSLFAVGRDITRVKEAQVELERAAAALAANDARIRSIFETTHLYQGFLAADGTLLDANAASLQGVQAARRDVIGKAYWETPWFAGTPGVVERLRALVARAAAGEPQHDLLHLQLPAGRRSFEFSLRPVREPGADGARDGGAVVALVPELLDVTSRIEAEEALRHAQKMEAVGQLTGGIAHDFNNLLQSVSGGLELLARRHVHNEEGLKIVRLVQRAASRGTHLTQQLLAFSRKQALEAKAVDVNAAVSASVELASRSLGAGVVVERVLGDGVWTAFADPNQLDVAVLNLLLNARDAMPAGGLVRVLTRNVTSPHAALPAELAPGAYVGIAVQDGGTGMSEAVRSRIFEPFFTTKGVGKGTGLGLSQVYGFARQSGGTVQVASEVGAGTTVEIFLPRTASAEAPVEADSPGALWYGRDTILVIDDDADVRQLAVTSLDELGYRVLEAGGGREGLAVLDREPDVALLLVDYAMPEMTGAEVVKAARAAGRDVEVLFMSGYADLAAIAEQVGSDLLIQKPFGMAALAERIGSALANRARQRAEAADAAGGAPA